MPETKKKLKEPIGLENEKVKILCSSWGVGTFSKPIGFFNN